jgi:hypothetical protein
MRTLAVCVLLALLAGCDADRARRAAGHGAPAGLTRYVDERRGFEVTFPSSWHRAPRVLTPALSNPREILSVGTVRPVVNDRSSRCGQHPTATLARVGPRDVFLTIQERANQLSPEMVPAPPRLADVTPDTSETAQCLARDVPLKTYWMPFRSGGRGFYANAAVGGDVTPRRRAQLQAVLDSLRFRAVHVEDDRQRGVRFAYPRPWRIYPVQLAGFELRHQIALGTFDLDQKRPDRGCMPKTALEARGRDGGLLFVFEYADLNETQEKRFPARPARFRLNPLDPVPYECLGVSYLLRWREPASGRVFQAHIYGPRRWVQQALGILDTFEISRQGG